MTTTEAESCLSVLKKVKIFLCGMMTQERLSPLMMQSIERDLLRVLICYLSTSVLIRFSGEGKEIGTFI